MTTRCEEVYVQLVIVTRDDDGDKVREVIAPPQQPVGVKVFRNAETRDFWAYVDGQVRAIEAAQAKQQTPPPPAAKQAKGKK